MILLAGLCSFNAAALRTVYFQLEAGSSAAIYSYENSTGEYTFLKALNPGNNVVELENREYYYLRPSMGAEKISVDPVDVCVYRNGTREEFVVFGGATIEGRTYTVTTTGGNGGKATATIHLAEGAQAYVLELNERTFEYTVHAELHEGDNEVVFETDSKAVPGTVPFYYLCGRDGYLLDVVTNEKGKKYELKENSEIGTFIELTAYTYQPYYSVTTKERPKPEGDPTFILTAGSRATYTPKNGGMRRTLVAGDNYVTLKSTDIILVSPADGHHFTSFTNNKGVAMTINNSGAVQIEGSNFQAPYYISTEQNAEPDPTYTIDIDDPDAVSCYSFPSYKTISLRKGINNLSYSIYGEKQIVISTINDGMYYTPFSSLKVNGVEQPFSSQHFIDLADGMEIVARVKYPEDVKYTITFDGPENFWTKVEVNDEAVTPVDNKLEVPAGARIKLYNTAASDWTISQINLPDNNSNRTITATTHLWFTATGDGKVYVNASQVKKYNIDLNIISGAESIKVIVGSGANSREIGGLRNGSNPLTIRDNNNIFTISHLDKEGVFHSVTYKETPDAELKNAQYNVYYRTYTIRGLGEGGVINIDAQEIDYANTCLIYVDNASKAYLTTDDKRTIMLKNGYNTIHFNDSENGNNGFATHAPQTAVLFCDDQKVSSASYINLENNKVYKLYTDNADPEFYNVRFNVLEGYTLINPVIDTKTPVSMTQTEMKLLPGTEISFQVNVAAGINKAVFVNENEITPDADGTYNVVITGETVIGLGEPTDGISSVTDDTENGTPVYFDLSGRQVSNDRLLPGIYVRLINGKATKVTVK